MPTVHIRDLVVEYTSNGYPIRPLDGLALDIGDGQLGLLLGPSGSGKTTLLSCLGGILRPTANLDYVQAEAIITLLREIATAGRTVIVSTHDDRLLPIADIAIDLVPSLSDDLLGATIALDAGDSLFRQGSMSNAVYIIESGRLEIVRELANGAEEVLTSRGPGEYVGELGPMLGQPRSATTRAAQATTVRSMSLQQFRQESRAGR